jgi:hypothetical protein
MDRENSEEGLGESKVDDIGEQIQVGLVLPFAVLTVVKRGLLILMDSG